MTAMAQPASPLSVGSLTQLTLSLIAIVALILAISWALKRLKLAGPRGSGEIAVLDELSVGPRERIVLGSRRRIAGTGGHRRRRHGAADAAGGAHCAQGRHSPRRRSPSACGT